MRTTQPLIALCTSAAWLGCALFAAPFTQDQAATPSAAAAPRAALKQDPQAKVGDPALVRKVRVAPVPNPAVLKNADARFNQTFRPYYYSRLIHARNCLHLSRDQLRALRPETDKAFKDFLVAFALEQERLRKQFLNPGFVTKTSGQVTDSFAEFEFAIAKIVKKHVDPALWPKYDAEVAQRYAANKEASLQLLMNALDQDLFLSPEQHKKLSSALAGQWSNTWNGGLQLLFNGSDHRPYVPDILVVPILNAEQREIWKSKRYQDRTFPIVTIPLFDEPRIDRELGGGDDSLDGGVKPGMRKAEPPRGQTGTTHNFSGDRSHVS
jgi:hypothetical protein